MTQNSGLEQDHREIKQQLLGHKSKGCDGLIKSDITDNTDITDITDNTDITTQTAVILQETEKCEAK